ncbi:pilus assembly protein [Nocardioides sp. Root140]|nr:pilus assembly protein [Nocardioides sp. Root140]
MTYMLIGDVQTGGRRRGEKGATATEYGLLVTFIALLIIAGVTLFGNGLNDFFTRLSTKVGGWAK